MKYCITCDRKVNLDWNPHIGDGIPIISGTYCYKCWNSLETLKPLNPKLRLLRIAIRQAIDASKR